MAHGMSRSKATVALESDMAAVGRGQRIQSSIFLAFGALLTTILYSNESALIWYLQGLANGQCRRSRDGQDQTGDTVSGQRALPLSDDTRKMGSGRDSCVTWDHSS